MSGYRAPPILQGSSGSLGGREADSRVSATPTTPPPPPPPPTTPLPRTPPAPVKFKVSAARDQGPTREGRLQPAAWTLPAGPEWSDLQSPIDPLAELDSQDYRWEGGPLTFGEPWDPNTTTTTSTPHSARPQAQPPIQY
ncbi:hypothetical protein EYF80_002264 [Liparis tanakae]|uniref:Uncharacterized protein n=1 Tax=Liparis tanakae TaxID=230148 RepID=A0A4Z2JC11_9TELE|nr:hypothetical protein EYF80_002264 [Liparis tanakae]